MTQEPSKESQRLDAVMREYVKDTLPGDEFGVRLAAGLQPARRHIRRLPLTVLGVAAAVIAAVLWLPHGDPTAPSQDAATNTVRVEDLTLRATLSVRKEWLAILENTPRAELNLYAAGDHIGQHVIQSVATDHLTLTDSGQATELRVTADTRPAHTAADLAALRAKPVVTLTNSDVCRLALWGRAGDAAAIAFLQTIATDALHPLRETADALIAGGQLSSMSRLFAAVRDPHHPYRAEAFRQLLQSDSLLARHMLQQVADDSQDPFHAPAQQRLAALAAVETLAAPK